MIAESQIRVTRPPVRWHGGKFGRAGSLADWVLAHVPPHECYVEPFGGGAAVLLRKGRSPNEVYNDLFGEVVTLFRVLRDRRRALLRAVSLTPYAEAEQRAAFARPAEGDDEIEVARRLLVRSWQSVGPDAASGYRRSGFRSGTKGSRNPARDWRGLPAALAAVADRLQGVRIYGRPYEYVLRKYDGPATAFYCDPTYLPETRSKALRRAYAHEMTEAEHELLAERLHALDAMVTLSGYDSEMYRRLYAGWHRVERRVFANGRGRVKPERLEVLWLNPAAHSALERGRGQAEMFGGEIR